MTTTTGGYFIERRGDGCTGTIPDIAHTCRVGWLLNPKFILRMNFKVETLVIIPEIEKSNMGVFTVSSFGDGAVGQSLDAISTCYYTQ